MEESKKKLKELEEWIDAYDEPVDRVCVADIFQDLKSEIEYWHAMYDGCLDECNNLLRLEREKVERYKKALEDVHSIAKFSRPDLVPNEVREIAWKALKD